ncbi:phosphodiester glycosidase family protein [Glutamicibacter sp.]|uniref:phosphodiester glycosidase family protein n=1 Tax=Glutamicibacter sp. TaxID=1931995 RepID=UPI0028BDA33D|nr:phosphodiester glycosidase family protein [Glutamicibacter sp.]
MTKLPDAPLVKKKPSRRTFIAGSLALLAGAGGTAGWALDRFVIEHVEQTDVSSGESSPPTTTDSGSHGADAAVLDENSYTSDLATITITEKTIGSGQAAVVYFVADLKLSEANVLRLAFAKDSFGENIIETTSQIAQEHDAVFAVNGDYYGFRDTGIVIRNGKAYRDKGAREALAFYADGSVKIYDERQTNASALVNQGVINTLSFGPAIVADGKVIDGIDSVEIDTNFGNHSIQGKQPRTAVGVLGDNHVVFVVVDGRAAGYSAGVSMPELASIMTDLGAKTAYNMDGGGSSTIYFNGRLVNNPLGRDKERGTSDVFYVAKQGQQ